ncbi:MAG: GNAT family N-acetyltransferase [Saprospiraceae bacterium]
MSLLYRIHRFFALPTTLCCPFTNVNVELSKHSTLIPTLTPRVTDHSPIENSQPMFSLSAPDYGLNFYTSIHDINTDWERATHAENRFLQRDYLATLEDNPPADMQFAYWVFYKKNQAVGVAIGQIVRFKVTENIKTENGVEKKSLVNSVKNKLTKWVAGSVGFNLLLVGSTLLTGEHGFYFGNECDKSLQLQLIQEALDIGKKELAKQNIQIDGNMLKDFVQEDQVVTQAKFIEEHQYSEFEFQPTMITTLREEWTCFEDYLDAMSSKYRVRAKRAHKKGKELATRSLSLEEIKQHQTTIYQLYQNVADAADVNMAQLHPDYFLKLKENLGDNFQLFGWFLEEKLIGFHTLIDDYQELEAHFLGLDHDFNRSHQLYLNMLYSMTDYGIKNKYESVAFARTALEIKSSVGAEPYRMYCYIRHNKNLPNRFLKSAVSYFEPNVEWKQRHPFK